MAILVDRSFGSCSTLETSMTRWRVVDSAWLINLTRPVAKLSDRLTLSMDTTGRMGKRVLSSRWRGVEASAGLRTSRRVAARMNLTRPDAGVIVRMSMSIMMRVV